MPISRACAATTELWSFPVTEALRQRILVTGAGGFVGRWAMARLSAALPGAEVLAAGHGVALALDVTRADEVDGLVRRVRPTAVIHLAGMSSPVKARAETRAAWDVNLFGTMNLAEAVLRHAPEARFINAGSSEIYGGSFNADGGAVDEDTPLAPLNPYATTKAAADLLLGQLAEEGLIVVRFRPFNHTGPGQSTAFALPSFAAQIAAAERGTCEPAIRVGNLDARRDFLDVRDVVEAYLCAITAPVLPRGAVLNLASGEPRRIGDALDALLAMSRVPIRIERDETLMRASDVPVTRGEAARARALLGWSPTIPWEQTLRDVLDDHRRRA